MNPNLLHDNQFNYNNICINNSNNFININYANNATIIYQNCQNKQFEQIVQPNNNYITFTNSNEITINFQDNSLSMYLKSLKNLIT